MIVKMNVAVYRRLIVGAMLLLNLDQLNSPSLYLLPKMLLTAWPYFNRLICKQWVGESLVLHPLHAYQISPMTPLFRSTVKTEHDIAFVTITGAC